MINNNRIEIELGNGYKLVAEQNTGDYDKEVFVGIVAPFGGWHQDLVCVRPTYKYDNDIPVWNPEQFDVLVWGDVNNDDFTENHIIDMYHEPEDEN